MLNPNNFRSRETFMKIAVAQVQRDGTDLKQAEAVCSELWSQRTNKKMVENKNFGGTVEEIKQIDRNGIKVGIVAGHLAAWSPDAGGMFGMPDRFHRGAFNASINEHKTRGNRPIKLRDGHGRTVGGFPIETVFEDEVGLSVVGEINLEVQQGAELHALARQRVVSDFSIGFIGTVLVVEIIIGKIGAGMYKYCT